MNDVVTDPRLLPGANNPPEPIVDKPYAEQMLDASLAARNRATQLIEGVNSAKIEKREDAEAVTMLANLVREQMDEMNVERVRLKKPWDDGAAAVQGAYQPTINLLKEALETCRKLSDRWRAAEDARLRAEEAARLREAEEARQRAEEAQRAKEAAEAAGDGKAALQAELDALNAGAEAERLAEPIESDRMIRTHAGSAGVRTGPAQVEIADLTKCLASLRKLNKAALAEAVLPLATKLVRGGAKVEGVTVTQQQRTTFRR